ncbi:S24 family peptidase [Aestuariivirga sp.]|uniref:S24 family peptidase n=1 Tax=Aestuariivirga sp. TaxID=2650926 RepID=UPI003016A11D
MGEVIQFQSKRDRTPGDDEIVHTHVVRGDSMEPTARHGDVWVYRPADRFTGPGVYALTDGLSYPVFKRLGPVPGAGSTRVAILSDNPAYERREADLAGLQILGRVVGVIAR